MLGRQIVIGVSVVLLFSQGCSSNQYGEFQARGSLVHTQHFEVIVPRDNLRVSVDNPSRGDLVMYEDFGTGMPRGVAFLVQSRNGALGLDLIQELHTFGGPDSPLLESAKILHDATIEDGEGSERSFTLMIPALEERDGSGWIVNRQALYMTGSLLESGGRVYRLQVAWNPLYSRGPGVEEQVNRELKNNQKALQELKSATSIKS